MPLAVLIVAFLAAAAVPAPDTRPILVTGHAWAPFISPMGEPFRAHSVTDDTLADWFRKADRNGDGLLTADEMVADADRFFATLDSDHNGEIEPDELAKYEYEIAPDVQVMSRTRPAPGEPTWRAARDEGDPGGGHGRRMRGDEALGLDQLGIGGRLQGAARYGLLDLPEPVAAADTDFDRGISLTEFRAAALRRFNLLDTAHRGSLTLAQLEGMRSAALANDHRTKHDLNTPDARIGNGLPPGR